MKPIHEELHGIFGADGWLTRNGRHHQPEQLQYALNVANWLTGDPAKPLALIEGETGIGKTLGYLFPIVLHWQATGARSIIATHTVALQNQILTGDMDIVEQYCRQQDRPTPRIVQRLGKQHFIDPNRVAQLLESEPDGSELGNLYEWATTSATRGSGLIDEWLETMGPLPEGVVRDSICLTPDSDDRHNPVYVAQKERSANADLVLTSHMMILLEAHSRRASLNLSDAAVGHILFDEADQVPASAESLSHRRTQPREIIRALKQLIGQGSTGLDKKLFAGMATLANLDQQLETIGQGPVAGEVLVNENVATGSQALECLNRLKAECASLATTIKRSGLGRASADHNEGVRSASELLEWASGFGESDNEARKGVHALSWSPVRKIPSLMYQKANPAFYVSNLWRHLGQRVCLTSATLGATASDTDPDPFIALKASMAMARNRICVEAQHAPRQFGSLAITLADPQAPRPVSDIEEGETARLNTGWVRYVALMIRKAMNDGPTLVLTVSYPEAISISKHLPSSGVLVHRRGTSLSDAIEAFQRGEAQVLITPAAWQGVSIRTMDNTQLIRNLVITRIPFTPPDATSDRLAVAVARNAGESEPAKARQYRAQNRRHQSLIKFRQGIGRLIRNPNDAGRLWIADPRFPLPASSSPHRFFARAIPIRFNESYQQAQLFSETGHSQPAQKEIPADLQEFFDL